MNTINLTHKVKMEHPKGIVKIGKRKMNGEVIDFPEFTNTATWAVIERLYASSRGYFNLTTNYTGTANGNGLFGALAVGTGNIPITKTSTGLTSEIARVALTGASVKNFPSPYTEHFTTIAGKEYLVVEVNATFPYGSVSGIISEVGIISNALSGSVPNANNNTLIFGTLIKDELGNPTTITVNADEQLFVNYTFYVYAGNENPVPNPFNSATRYDVLTGNVVTVGGIDYGYDVYFNRRVISTRELVMTYLPNSMSYVGTSYPLLRSTTPTGSLVAGGITGQTNEMTKTVDLVNKTSTITYIGRLIPEAGNVYVRAISLPFISTAPGNAGSVMVVFTDPIPKTDAETIEFTFTYIVDWSGN